MNLMTYHFCLTTYKSPIHEIFKQGTVYALFISKFSLVSLAYNNIDILYLEAADEIPASPSLQLRERTTELCFNILHSYRQVSGSFSKDLLLPERLKLLPLYILALSKSLGLQAFGWLDGKSYWRSRVSSISVALAVPLVYPRMMAIHRLLSQEADGTPSTPTIPLSTEFITEDGIFLLENGEDAVIYVGEKVDVCLFQQLFGMHFNDASNQFVLQQYENPSSRKFNDLINGIRRLRCCYLCLHFYKKGDPSEVLFQSYMVEDKNAESLSYVEFLRHIGSKINSKLSKERRVLQI
ncbi:hypothetical protein Tsubulata_030784 [Turnera subulata]|uniref:Sec23/Sec24 helical domain-containing protein n=1 Tax=Turnera subulata TaxID=218843 RepID=A0A9Q0FJI3_9ROSI|nr:hypothetical protein Tsubulata_030784 [Turnera subulata]